MKTKILLIIIFLFPLFFIFVNVNLIHNKNKYLRLKSQNFILYKENESKVNEDNEDFVTYLNKEPYIVDINNIYMFRYSSNYILIVLFFQLFIVVIFYIIDYIIKRIHKRK